MTGDLSKDGERKRIPGRQQLVLGHLIAVLDQDVRAVNDLVASDLAAAFINDRKGAIAIHGYALALAALDGLQIDVFDRAFDAGFVLRRLFQTRGAADVKRAHRQLRARFANRLSGNNADRFADIDRPSGSEVAAVALDAATAARFAGQDRADAHALDT